MRQGPEARQSSGTGTIAIRLRERPVPEGGMSARIVFCLAAMLLIAATGGAGADSNLPSVGSAPPSSNASPSPSGAPAYSQAATSDPYNQSDFSSEQSFGLVAS